MSGLSDHQAMTIIRAATLLDRHGAELTVREHDVAHELVSRFRRKGRAMAITEDEWRLVAFAVDVMSAATQRRAG